jgi:soluble lytic murein transglycosylase
VTPQQDAATSTTSVALPDRSPKVAAAGVILVNPKSDAATATTSVPLPDRNPKGPMLAIVTPPLTPGLSLATPVQPKVEQSAVGVSDVPLPDPNPNRAPTATPFEMRGTLAPAIQAPAPPMDYAAILKPLVFYDISAADEANLREVLRGGGAAAAAKIQDSAVRAFALWYRYQAPGVNGSGDAIEQFRLAHPDWPGQDDLREKAEAALFLNDASPEQVKAFFAASGPQTGAGKAALAGVYLKEGNETGAHDLVVSAWRDHELNAAVETKILNRFGYMLTAENHRQRIDRLLYPDDKSATAAALRVAKLLSADDQKKVAARIAVVQRGGNAGKLLEALPGQRNPG